MELGLAGKVVLVTGSSKGIGRSIAAAFAREGCNVVVNGRHAAELEVAAAEMRGASGAVHAVVADVTEAEGAKRAVEETVRRFGTIHVLVNNAGGVGRFAAFAELTDDEWLDVFKLNVLSAVRATRAALPHMQKQKWGRIINISSESGTQPDPIMPHYNSSKAALNSLTKGWNPHQHRLARLYPHSARRGNVRAASESTRGFPRRGRENPFARIPAEHRPRPGWQIGRNCRHRRFSCI